MTQLLILATGIVALATSLHGATDDVAHRAVVDKVSVHDLHATLLHFLGIDHEKLSFRFQGLDQRLVGVEPCQVMTSILT